MQPTNEAPDPTAEEEEADDDVDIQDETIIKLANEPLDAELALIRTRWILINSPCTKLKTT